MLCNTTRISKQSFVSVYRVYSVITDSTFLSIFIPYKAFDLRRMASSEMLGGVVHVGTFFTVTRIGELGTTLAVTSNRRTLRASYS
jgi:hypothetical protein